MQQKVWLRAEQKKGGDVCLRQSTPHLHHSMRSATNVARRALVASISTPYGEDKSTQCAIFHAEVAPQEIKPQHIIWPRQRGENSHAAQLARWQATQGWRANVKPPDCLPLRNVVEGNWTLR